MQLTFLKMVQRGLSALSSQSVSSAGDSVESEQVGVIVNRVYEEILARRDWPFLRKSGYSLVTNTPSIAWEVELPSDCRTVEYIRYNEKDVHWLSPEDFRKQLDYRDSTVSWVNSSLIYTDRDPTYYTSVDEESIVLDAYDSTYATILPSLFFIQYIRNPTSELTNDSDIPEIPTVFHNVLMDGVLTYVYYELLGDVGKGDRYFSKYTKGLARMNVWARKFENNQPNYLSKYTFGRSAL